AVIGSPLRASPKRELASASIRAPFAIRERVAPPRRATGAESVGDPRDRPASPHRAAVCGVWIELSSRHGRSARRLRSAAWLASVLVALLGAEQHVSSTTFFGPPGVAIRQRAGAFPGMEPTPPRRLSLENGSPGSIGRQRADALGGEGRGELEPWAMPGRGGYPRWRS